MNGLDILRMAGILFEFLPQPCNVYVNGQLQKQCPAHPRAVKVSIYGIATTGEPAGGIVGGD